MIPQILAVVREARELARARMVRAMVLIDGGGDAREAVKEAQRCLEDWRRARELAVGMIAAQERCGFGKGGEA